MTTTSQATTVPGIGELTGRDSLGLPQLRIIALCMIFNMIDGFDITAMAVVADALGREMQIAEDQLGLVFSFALAGMMIGAMFLASLSDIFGRRTVIIGSLVAIGASVLLTGYVEDLYTLIFLRFISGLGAGAMLASQAALAAEYSPDRYRALSVAIVTSGYPLGAMFTGLVAEPVMSELGWRGMFIAGGGLTLAMGLVAYAFLSESLEYLFKHRPPNALAKVNAILAKLGASRLESLPEVPRNAASAARGSVSNNIGLLVKEEFRARTIILWTSFFLAMVSMYFLMSWIPKLMINSGFSSAAGNLAFSAYNFGGVAGIFILGLLATRWPLFRIVSLFMITAGALMVFFAALPSKELLLISVIAIIGVFLQGAFTGLYALAAKVYPVNIRSTGVGFAIGMGRLGAVFGPAVAGYLIASGTTMQLNFVVFAIPMLIGGVCILWIRVH